MNNLIENVKKENDAVSYHCIIDRPTVENSHLSSVKCKHVGSLLY